MKTFYGRFCCHGQHRAARLMAPPWVALAFCVALSGCATIQSTSVSEIQKGPGHRIRAEDRGHGFFMISLPDLDATARLKAQCAGTVTGVQTTTWLRNWFLVVQNYRQEALGWCQTN